MAEVTATTVGLSGTGDFVTTTLNGAISSGATSATIGTGLNIPAANGFLMIDYDSSTTVGSDNGPETIKYTAYTSGTGALTGLTRGADAYTSGVAHANGATVQAGISNMHLNNLQDLIENTVWSTWTPTYGGGGTQTFTTVTTTKAVYRQVGKVVFFQLSAVGTTGGGADPAITFTLPVTAKTATSDAYGGGASCYDGGYVAGMWNTSSATVVNVRKYNAANWGAGATKQIVVNGCYDAA